MRTLPRIPSRVRFLTLDLCLLKQQTQLLTSWSELQIFHLAGRHESVAPIVSALTAPTSAHHILMHLFTFPHPSLPWSKSTSAASFPLSLIPRQRCHQIDAWTTLSSAFPCCSAPCCLSLFQGGFLPSELSNLRNNELDPPPLFRECTEQSREELFKFNKLWLNPALHWALEPPSQFWGGGLLMFCATSNVSGPRFFSQTFLPADWLWSWNFETQSASYIQALVFPFSFLFFLK